MLNEKKEELKSLLKAAQSFDENSDKLNSIDLGELELFTDDQDEEEVFELLEIVDERNPLEINFAERVDLEAAKELSSSDTIEEIFNSMSRLVKVKNNRYGNSVMEPLGIFNKYVRSENEESLNGILVRLDDKLKRIKNSVKLRKNDVSDLIGYLAFLCASKGWTNFDDLID